MLQLQTQTIVDVEVEKREKDRLTRQAHKSNQSMKEDMKRKEQRC